MKRDSFIFYRSFFEAMIGLKDKEKLQLFNAICEMSLNNNELKLTGVCKNIFCVIRPQIVVNGERYENGKKGGRPKTETDGFPKTETDGFPKTETDGFQTQKPNNNVNDNVNVNVNVNDGDNARHARDTTTDFLKKYSLSNLPNYGGLSKQQKKQLESICSTYSLEQLNLVIDYCSKNNRFVANLPYIIENINTLVDESSKEAQARHKNEEAARAEKNKQHMREFLAIREEEIKRELYYEYERKFGKGKWTQDQFSEYENACNEEIKKIVKQITHNQL